MKIYECCIDCPNREWFVCTHGGCGCELESKLVEIESEVKEI